VIVMSVRIKDGGVITGEYVGAQEGYLYLAANGEIMRLKQSDIENHDEETP
jgi:hypothetical protein